MIDEVEREILRAVAAHPSIVGAAVTGSRARGTDDAHSDLDMLLVVSTVLDRLARDGA